MKEADIQISTVREVLRAYKGARIFANPLSELQIHFTHEVAKMKALAKAKAMGWDKNHPDLLIFIPDHHGKPAVNIAVELKTKAENPFRQIRGKGVWINDSRARNGTGPSKAAARVIAQAQYLYSLSGNFDFCFFACHTVEVLTAIESVRNGSVKDYFRKVMVKDQFGVEFPTWTHHTNLLPVLKKTA